MSVTRATVGNKKPDDRRFLISDSVDVVLLMKWSRDLPVHEHVLDKGHVTVINRPKKNDIIDSQGNVLILGDDIAPHNFAARLPGMIVASPADEKLPDVVLSKRSSWSEALHEKMGFKQVNSAEGFSQTFPQGRRA